MTSNAFPGRFVLVLLAPALASCAVQKGEPGPLAPEAAASVVAQEARLEALKSLHYIEYIEKKDWKGACEYAEQTLRTDMLLLDPEHPGPITKEDLARNRRVYEMIEEHFRQGGCVPPSN
jgi:hypothetical protein